MSSVFWNFKIVVARMVHCPACTVEMHPDGCVFVRNVAFCYQCSCQPIRTLPAIVAAMRSPLLSLDVIHRKGLIFYIPQGKLKLSAVELLRLRAEELCRVHAVTRLPQMVLPCGPNADCKPGYTPSRLDHYPPLDPSAWNNGKPFEG